MILPSCFQHVNQDFSYNEKMALILNNFIILDKSVLVENMPLIKSIRNYIQDSSGIFSTSSLVRISLTSFPAFTLSFVQKHSCLHNQMKITRQLEDINFISSW